MASDVNFALNAAKTAQAVIPTTISEELEGKFLKKFKSSSITLIPISIVVAVVVIAILVAVVYFLNRVVIGFFALVVPFYPIYAVYNAISMSNAIKKHDYEFFYATVVGKNDNGSYILGGLEGQSVAVLLGKKDYNAGDKVLVGRVKDELNILAEE